MAATQTLQDGRLNDAIDEALREVKAKPAEINARGFLCELLCFGGDLERADKQLDTISTLDPKRAHGVAVFRQLIRGEQSRRECFESGRMPEFLTEPSAEMQLRLRALVALRENRQGDAAEALAEAESKRPRVSGTCDGEAFDDLRDLDDLTASFLEVLTNNGKYYWVPFESIQRIEIQPLARNRDLLWRHVHIEVHDGPDGEVYLPALYPGTHRVDDDRLRLGRMTEWKEAAPGVVRGVGQRTLLVGEQDRPLHELTNIEFGGATRRVAKDTTRSVVPPGEVAS